MPLVKFKTPPEASAKTKVTDDDDEGAPLSYEDMQILSASNIILGCVCICLLVT